MDVTYRRATADDVASLCFVPEHVEGIASISRHALESIFALGSAFIAEVEGGYAGQVMFRHYVPVDDDRTFVQLYMLYVQPEYRSRGIATALLSLVEDFAAGLGAEGVILAVSTANEFAKQIYVRRGYVAFSEQCYEVEGVATDGALVKFFDPEIVLWKEVAA